VLIATPDHWHTKMVIDACRAGKDVYCEKPVTLTVDEGKLLLKVVKETGRVVQVGTWQRSDWKFRLACEMVRAGRIGKLHTVTVTTSPNPSGGPFPVTQPYANLNWDMWQGQTPDVPYIRERCHYTFRWWYEYSGGQLTDWGAHGIDIAHWGMGIDSTGPLEINGTADVLPNDPYSYNVPPTFSLDMKYPDDVTLKVRCDGRAGILFEGDQGRLFVNRGTVAGKAVDELKENPLSHEQFKLYAHDNRERPERTGKLDAIINHMGNFFDCVKTRQTPISEIVSQHRVASACHLGNISIRLRRPLKWNPAAEQFVGDAEADTWLRREQRKKYAIS
jgi:myo-inositol 2-dehydrogenase / D-chiro-inositol 1-dehydrogenase